ncbi:MAG: pentapeptide repeat-containing protein, partial [Nitrospira sp.]|nr:pentapeptide repeat-containing protein [Nitrospira sp.]
MTRSFLPTICASIVLLMAFTVTETEAAGPSASQPTSPAVPLCKSLYKKKSVPVKTLQALVRSHERWVEYRGNPNAKRLELCQADLTRATLSEANLERANLEGAVLRQANLSQATLAQASLAGADLSKTILKDSNLSGADLRRARLAGANLSRAIGDEAAFFDAVLSGAKL